MNSAAYLIGLSQYPGHLLAGVPNDLALMQCALVHQGFAPAAIHLFGDEVGTRAGLHTVLANVRADFANGEQGHCFVYFSGSGMLSFDPLLGGIKPLDGDDLDFTTALSFVALNEYLPVRPGMRVTVVLDC
jgi:hypothetical protein